MENPISIFLQIPIIAAFIWFTLKLSGENNKAIANILEASKAMLLKMSEDAHAANALVMADWRKYLADRDEQWRGFLAEQRQSQNETMDVFATRLEGLTKVVADLDRHIRGDRR